MIKFFKQLFQKPALQDIDWEEHYRNILILYGVGEKPSRASQEEVEAGERRIEFGRRLALIDSTCNSMAEWLRNVRALEAEFGRLVPSDLWVKSSQCAMASCRLAGTRAKAKIDKHMSNGGRIARASRNATRNTTRIRPPTTIVSIHG